MEYDFYKGLLQKVRYCNIASLSQFPDPDGDSSTSSSTQTQTQTRIPRNDQSYEGTEYSESDSTRRKFVIQPHCTIVFFHVDKDGIYWTSARESQHSINFYMNEAAYITIFEENLLEGTGNEKGLYLQGTVDILTDRDSIIRAKTLSCEKANLDRKEGCKLTPPEPEQFMGNSVRAVYKFSPERAWTNTWEPDEQGRYCDSRRALNVQKLFPLAF
jgi:hypothetical protein